MGASLPLVPGPCSRARWRVSFCVSPTPAPPLCPVPGVWLVRRARKVGTWEGRVGGPWWAAPSQTTRCGSGLAVWMEGPGEVVGFLRLSSDVLAPRATDGCSCRMPAVSSL